jgi:hypothetical protein
MEPTQMPSLHATPSAVRRLIVAVGCAIAVANGACRSKVAPARSRPGPVGAVAPAPWIAGLFADDRALTYDLTYLHDEVEDDRMVQHEATGRITCQRTLATYPGWWVATIACDVESLVVEDGDSIPSAADVIDAVFVSDGRNVWRRDELDPEDPATSAALAALAKETPDLPAAPTATEERSASDEDGFVTVRTVSGANDQWCVEERLEGGDGSSSSWCLGPGGLEAATSDQDGAAEYYWSARLQ